LGHQRAEIRLRFGDLLAEPLVAAGVPPQCGPDRAGRVGEVTDGPGPAQGVDQVLGGKVT
jgi:hypothetical protein